MDVQYVDAHLSRRIVRDDQPTWKLYELTVRHGKRKPQVATERRWTAVGTD